MMVLNEILWGKQAQENVSFNPKHMMPMLNVILQCHCCNEAHCAEGRYAGILILPESDIVLYCFRM